MLILKCTALFYKDPLSYPGSPQSVTFVSVFKKPYLVEIYKAALAQPFQYSA